MPREHPRFERRLPRTHMRQSSVGSCLWGVFADINSCIHAPGLASSLSINNFTPLMSSAVVAISSDFAPITTPCAILLLVIRCPSSSPMRPFATYGSEILCGADPVRRCNHPFSRLSSVQRTLPRQYTPVICKVPYRPSNRDCVQILRIAHLRR